jgi:hypothetical protein
MPSPPVSQEASVSAPLWDVAAHEPLRVEIGEWTPQLARTAIDAIIDRTRAGFERGRFRPRHADDDSRRTAAQDLSLWTGAAGVLWALEHLGAGVGEAGVLMARRPHPDRPENTGLMQGEAGVLLLSWKLEPTPEKLDRLLTLVADSLSANPSDELFEGTPGTLLAALHVHRATGSERAAAIWRDGAAQLLGRFRLDLELGHPIWVQHRRGRLIRSLGAGHGLASNVASLLGGRSLLADEVGDRLEHQAASTAAAFALEQDGLVNWPTAADPYWAEVFPARVQWCHGAPGMITSLSGVNAPELDPILAAAGELIWRAGPLRKGAGLCHGTAGNALALLALHRRTGDETWRQRARALALHAVGQLEAAAPRHSLWTGDIGVALALDACLNGYQGVPIIDFL